MSEKVLWVGGWKENSLVDVLENVSFTLWLSFCNFKCPWCANSGLARGVEKKPVSIDLIAEAVRRTASFVDYFHVTGGEPTLQYKPLSELLYKVKSETGLKVSLDTNASIPEALKQILGRVEVDHIAIDVKAPLSNPEKYSRVIGVEEKYARRIVGNVEKGILESSRVSDFLELRSLMVPGLIDVEDIVEVAKEILNLQLKAPRLVYVVQQFIPYSGVPEEYRKKPKTPRSKVVEAAQKAKEILEGYAEVYYRTIEDGSKRV